MTDQITIEVFAHLVELAALELDEKEAEYLRTQLNLQLKAIHELAAIPLEAGTPLTSHGVPYTAEITPAIRQDEWLVDPSREAILAQAPASADGYIVVPDIPHEELD
jgi:aspartyl-tRNA(Asn)/glutamyl-tRNA(Gln) amidotransferase subunit C